MSDDAITVVIPCHTVDRLANIRAAVKSVQTQTLPSVRVVVAVDNNEKLFSIVRDEFPRVLAVLNRDSRGASATRNAGVRVATTPLVAFLDDDEFAEPDWLSELIRPFAEDTTVGCGGKYVPVWARGEPRWLPEDFAWTVGGSYRGQPTVTSRVRNVWSGNMAVRTAAFLAVGGFRTDFGKVGSVCEPEDTDLCVRMAAACEGHWVYVPTAVINHEVPASRSTFRFFLKRCFSEGQGKAALESNIGHRSTLDAERDFVRRAACSALRRLCGDASNRIKGLAALCGLAAAAVGYLAARFRAVIPQRMLPMPSDLRSPLCSRREIALPPADRANPVESRQANSPRVR
ncbi:glycosyltransferase [Mycobacterium sp. SMC-8]|uniref:glycosyltransferase family 2 protein n=1 Tax=Mycobacterium sp. SMC-8 TaxID=2857060 RepID=UPI0021B35CE7|nr:glycosyltransferase [Mycobacterium sp. SMC-8]UXA12759.1 glycosyltransferase [Mycobacterium sp. SMC-8]